MVNSLLYIVWNADPEMFTIPGIDWPVRWYGLLFAVAFIGSQFVMNKVYKAELRPQKHLDILTMYIIIGTVVGARLGHCLFYDWSVYKHNLLGILKIWEGGLASHGGAIGIIIAMILYCRKTKENWRWIFDRLIIVVALSSLCIRSGNLMNSEIIGKPTNASYAVAFVNPLDQKIKDNAFFQENIDFIKKVDYKLTGKDTVISGIPCTSMDVILTTKQPLTNDMANKVAYRIDYYSENYPEGERHIFSNESSLFLPMSAATTDTFTFKVYAVPRHPAQVYEGIFCLFLFILFYYLWAKKRDKFPQLFLFGLFCVLMFTQRFFVEMLKENQVGFEEGMKWNMGQLLSIPFVVGGIIIMIWSKKKNIYHTLPEPEKIIKQNKD